VARALRVLGENVHLARKRRGLSQVLVAERSGMSVPTLRSLERGSPTVTLAALANLLHSLGLEGDLQRVAQDDDLGRRLQDAKLLGRAR
jgi:transcriptional regulator with XRE-family HTH domain